jgi:hypothetical protein
MHLGICGDEDTGDDSYDDNDDGSTLALAQVEATIAKIKPANEEGVPRGLRRAFS